MNFIWSKLGWKGDYSCARLFMFCKPVDSAGLANQSMWKWIFTGLVCTNTQWWGEVILCLSGKWGHQLNETSLLPQEHKTHMGVTAYFVVNSTKSQIHQTVLHKAKFTIPQLTMYFLFSLFFYFTALKLQLFNQFSMGTRLAHYGYFGWFIFILQLTRYLHSSYVSNAEYK